MTKLVSELSDDQRRLVLRRLGRTLNVFLGQRLIPHADGSGSVLASECYYLDHLTRRHVENCAFDELYQALRTSSTHNRHLNGTLALLCMEKKITKLEAFRVSTDVGELRDILDRLENRRVSPPPRRR